MAFKAKVRPASVSDFEAIAQVCGRNGMPISDRPAWERGWTAHPFRDQFEGIPIGWVLEGPAGEVVGSISNHFFLYQWQGQTIRAAAAGNWAVDTEHRSSSLSLGSHFFGQKNLDLLLNASASMVAAQLMPLYKALKVPSPGYDQSFLWVVSPRRAAASALAKKKIPAAGLASFPAGAALWARDVFKRSGRGSPSTRLIELQAFDERFDQFWQRRSLSAKHLVAIRNQSLLTWRYASRLEKGLTFILVLEENNAMAGYVILNRYDRAGLKTDQITDLQVLSENGAHVRDLVLGAIAHARKSGADMVEMQGFGEFKRNAARALNPHVYQYPVWQTFYKAVKPELQTALADASSWDASPFDSD